MTAGGVLEPIYGPKEATIETPPTQPHERGSYRLMKQTGKEGPTTYNDMASTEKKNKKKRKRNESLKRVDEPPGVSVGYGNGGAKDKALQELLSLEARPLVGHHCSRLIIFHERKV